MNAYDEMILRKSMKKMKKINYVLFTLFLLTLIFSIISFLYFYSKTKAINKENLEVISNLSIFNGSLVVKNGIMCHGSIVTKGITIFNDNWKPRILLYPENIQILDENEKIRTSIGSTKLTNKKVGGTEITPESSLVFFEKDGTVLLQIPRE